LSLPPSVQTIIGMMGVIIGNDDRRARRLSQAQAVDEAASDGG